MEKQQKKACNRLSILSSSLTGVGALLCQMNKNFDLTTEEMSGVGDLIQNLGKEAQIIEDLLRCGEDYIAD